KTPSTYLLVIKFSKASLNFISSTPFIALFQFPYWSEPTGLYVLLSWYFLGINPNSSPTNSLTS
ncbi:hypothetical protein ACEUVV_13490, partial [Staphylococcus pseudintermedius]